jgi:hypothetical protein
MAGWYLVAAETASVAKAVANEGIPKEYCGEKRSSNSIEAKMAGDWHRNRWEFLRWCDESIRSQGKPGKEIRIGIFSVNAAEDQTGISQQYVSRWRNHLADLRVAICGVSCHICGRIVREGRTDYGLVQGSD